MDALRDPRATLGQEQISVARPDLFVLTGTPETADVPISERELMARPAPARWPWAVAGVVVVFFVWQALTRGTPSPL